MSLACCTVLSAGPGPVVGGLGAILLFTRAPLPGACKTRLLPVLSGEACAALQGAMVADALAALKPLGLDILEDMLFHSRFDQGDVETERGVIFEEIGMPVHMAQLGIKPEHYGKLAENTLRTVGGPVKSYSPLDKAAILEIYRLAE